MNRRFRCLFALAFLPAMALADPLPVGFVSFDSGNPAGTAGVFDIVNLTGTNSSTFPDTSFPITTPVSLSNLMLTVDFAGGGFTTLGPANFVSDGSGGFTGNSIFDLSRSPIANAILSGSFTPNTVQLNDGTNAQLAQTFSTEIIPSAGSQLQIGDFALINSAVPEPATWTMLSLGLLLTLLFRKDSRKTLRNFASSSPAVIRPLLLSLAAVLMVQASASAQVRLTASAQPATGNAGVTVENLVGSGFPGGQITPATLTVSFAATCGGAAIGTATPSTVTTVVGTVHRISFTLPATLPAGSYAVSVSGTTSTNASFTTTACSSITVQGADLFVHSVNGQLTLNGMPFRFGGGNDYSLMYSSPATVDQVLQTAVDNHLKVIRMWGFIDIGNADGTNSVRGKANGFYFQYWNGTAPAYNDSATGLTNLDYAIAKAGQLGLKLIIPFTNNWTDFGGMDQYVKWKGDQFHDDFYTDPVIRQWYKDWINHLLTRVNTITGVAYKDDPTIMVWELANEPRCGGSGTGGGGYPSSGNCTTQTVTSWVQDSVSFIKSVDPNHLVSVGDEGFYCHPGSNDWIDNCSQGVDTIAFSQVPGVDLMGFHLYPEGWGRDIPWSEQYTNQHLTDAHTLGKTAYLGEFGLLSGNTRNTVYKDWTDRALTEGGAGGLFWDLMAGQPSPTTSESQNSFDIRAGSPILITMGNFAQEMAANTALPFAPVAGYQWATTAFNNSVTLNPLQNDVAYAGNTINPNSIDLDPATPGQQTSMTVAGGTFSVAGSSVLFTPNATFSGVAQGSYTVMDSAQKLSNPAYLFVTVKPSDTGAQILESFETGTDGWGPLNSASSGTVAQSTAFHTDGNSGLQVNVTNGDWFGASFPSSVDISGRPALSIDIETTGAGGGVGIAFQSGSNYNWCQTQDPWPTLATNTTTTVTIPLDAAHLNCFGGPPDLTQIHTVFVFLGPGTYYLDDLRAEPKTNPTAATLIESFESGSDGWHSINGKPSTVAQTTTFHTDGNNGLQIDDASGNSDWFGFNLPAPLDISTKSTIQVDYETTSAGSSTAIAIQTGSGFTWCQTANWGFQNAATTGTVTLNLKTDCPNADLTSVRAVWVWIGGGGTFFLDNLRAQ